MADEQAPATPVKIGPSGADLLAANNPANSSAELDLYGARTQLAKVEALELENQQLKNDIADRKRYAEKIFVLICVWLSVVLMIVLGTGLKWLVLSDAVLVALITTTTINVLGLFLVVANYLFYRPKKESSA